MEEEKLKTVTIDIETSEDPTFLVEPEIRKFEKEVLIGALGGSPLSRYEGAILRTYLLHKVREKG